jgi:hypothetical protein
MKDINEVLADRAEKITNENKSKNKSKGENDIESTANIEGYNPSKIVGPADGEGTNKEVSPEFNHPLLNAMKDNKNKTDQLRAKMESVKDQASIPTVIPVKGGEGVDTVDVMLQGMEEDRQKDVMGISEDEDIQSMLDKIEEDKLFSSIVPNKEITGPSDYQVVVNEDLVNTIEEICDINNIKVTKCSNGEKNAILDRFANSGDEVSMPLVNSGMFVKFSGIGSGEIVSMNKVKANNRALIELTQIDTLCQHITGSSVGRMTTGRLIKCTSFYDKDTLFYGEYAATFPDESELSRQCEKCGAEFYVTVKTPDLLLNSDEFTGRADYIRHNITNFEDLIIASELGKVHIKKHSSGMIVHYKHPSIDTYIRCLQGLRDDVIQKYPHIVDVVYGVEKLYIPNGKGGYVCYTDLNEIVVIIAKLRNTIERYEIIDMVNDLRPSAVPVYGFKECKCPACDHKNPQQPFAMSQLLFFQGEKEEEMKALEWTAKVQARQKAKKALRIVN